MAPRSWHRGRAPVGRDLVVFFGVVALRPGARASSVAFAFAVVLSTRPASATEVTVVSLDYQTDPALSSCPTDVDFRKKIARLLRRDPFRESASRRIVVRIGSNGGRTEGRIEWRNADDQWQGERTLLSRNNSCADMGRAVALATAIQIQLFASLDEGAPEEPSPETEPPVDDIVERIATEPAIATEPPAPARPRQPWLAFEAGIGVIQDLSNAPAFAVPRLVILLGRPSSLTVRLTASGLGPGADVTEPGGTAQLDRLLATVELIRFFRTERRIQPLLAAGAGAQDVRVHGISAMPLEAAAHDGQVFSGLLTAGAGLGFAMTTRVSVVVEADALLFWPSVTVSVASFPSAASLNGVAVFAHGGVLARF